MSDKIVSYQLDGNVCTITMDDGKANSVGFQLMKELNEALDQAEADKAVVILTGREGKFSAGFDLNVFQQGGDALVDMLKSGAALSQRMLAHPYPIIVAANGHALAMGALYLLSVDYRIGVDGKFKVGLNEVAIGMTMPHFGVELSRYRLAPVYFNRCLNNAEIFSPAAAVAPGYLDEVVQVDSLMIRAKEKAAELATLNMDAYLGTKMRTRGAGLKALSEALEADFGELG